jgi:hypothetical protein
LLGAAAGGIFASATNRRFIARTEWNRFEEDEADRLAFDWLLAAKLNVTEVPRVPGSC